MPRAETEYMLRQEAMIRPFIVPRQEMVMKTYTIVPMTLPNSFENARRGRLSPNGQVEMMVFTSPTMLIAQIYSA